jgi:ketosteroid isomerase-like protein
MKKHILSALLVALVTTALAERPSSDELALRLGVRDWFLLHSTSADQFGISQLKAIYRPDVEFNAPTSGAESRGQGLPAYAALWQPLAQSVEKLAAKFTDEMKVTVEDSKAVTTFTFRPEGTYKDGRPLTCQTRISLTWERRDGMWKIVREEFTPLNLTPIVATAK